MIVVFRFDNIVKYSTIVNAVCDRIENFDRNKTGFESFWPEPNCKPEKVDRIGRIDRILTDYG